MGFDSVNIILVSRCKYCQPNSIPQHHHDFYHLIYIVGGEGIINVNGNENKVLENHIYIIKPGLEHGIIPNSSNPLRTVEVKFTVGHGEIADRLNILPSKIDNGDGKIRIILENLMDEAINKDILYKEIINAGLTELLLRIIRSCNLDNVQKASNCKDYFINENSYGNENEILSEVVSYINNNYNKKITLIDLSKISTLNQAYLCRIFSKKYEISPIQYINHIRLQKAKELLVYSDENITEISEHVGFQSIHYFSRYFTSKEKVTPLEYRHSIKENVYIAI